MTQLDLTANVAKEILRRIAAYPASVAMQVVGSHGLQSTSYQQLLAEATALSVKFREIGIEKGHRIALLGHTSTEWVITFLAILLSEATAVLLDPGLDPDALDGLCQHADPALICIATPVIDKISIQIKQHYLCAEMTALNPKFQIKLLGNTAIAPPDIDCDPNIAAMLYTSGTTGKFKAVLLEHQAFMHVLAATKQITQITTNDNFLCLLPAHHVYSLVCVILPPLLFGAQLTFVESLKTDLILNAMSRTKPTIFVAVPRLLELIFHKIEIKIKNQHPITQTILQKLLTLSHYLKQKHHLPTGKLIFYPIHKFFGGKLRLIISGSAPINSSLYTLIESLGFTVLEGYGLSETTAFCSIQSPTHRRIGSVGNLIRGLELKINEPDNTGQGEICLKGPTIMRGYFRNDAATKESLQAGWLHTGDLGRIDNRNFLYITGRIKELIVLSNGKKVSPQMLEDAYQNISGVSDLAIVGVANPESGSEEIHAAIVVENLTSILKSDIEREISARSKRHPAWWSISQIHFVDSLPKTTTLKVQRKILSERLASQTNHSSRTKPLTLDEDLLVADEMTRRVSQTVLSACVHQKHQLEKIALNTSFQWQLSLDSLVRIEIKSNLEQIFEIQIPLLLFNQVDNISELSELIKTQLNSNQLVKGTAPGGIPPEYLKEIEERVSFLTTPTSWQYRTRKFLRFLLRTLCKFYFKMEVFGLDNFNPDEVVIFCPNHSSHLDNLILSLATRLTDDSLVYMAAKDYFFKTNLRARLLSTFLNIIPLDRSGSALSLEMNKQYLLRCKSHHKHIVLFPEGTRSVNGQLQEFKVGVALFADELKIRIVPVYIDGTHKCLAKGSFFPKPGNISITFGKPMQFNSDNTSVENPYHHYREFIDELKTQMILLSKHG